MPQDPSAPVNVVDTGSDHDVLDKPQDGIALCLSGGGYRAMLFHLGSLWRLNELGFLPKLARISSVSGGSITAGVLGLNWGRLSFDANGVAAGFADQVIAPIRTLAGRTIDEGAILGGLLLPGSVSDKVTDTYRKVLFNNATLQELPDAPRFVINATSVQSGALFRFSKPFAADYRVGLISNPAIELAVAVAASSAFPPVLSPCKIELDPDVWDPPSGTPSEDLHRAPFLSHVVLTDGGVYDNLGLETAWKKYKTILVSDGGGKMQAEEEPNSDWARHAIRVNDIIDNQVRSRRKSQVIGSFKAKPTDAIYRTGTYWGIRSQIDDYGIADALPCPSDKTLILAATPTRLKRLDDSTQERIINWGYAVADAAIRKHVVTTAHVPHTFPYSNVGVG